MSTALFADASPQRGWSLQATRFSVHHNKHFESLFTIGSGYVNVRAALPEGLADDPQNVTFMRMPGNVTLETFRPSKSKWGTYIPGFADRHPLLNVEMVNLPFCLGCTVEADGERLDMEASTVADLQYWLDLRDGVVHRTLTWRTRRGAELRVSFHMYAHIVRQHIVWQQICVQARRGSAHVRVTPFLDADVRTNGYDHWRACKVWGNARGELGTLVQTHGGAEACEEAVVMGMPRWKASAGARAIRLTAQMRVSADEPMVITKVVALATSLDARDPRGHARRDVRAALRLTPGALYAEHRALWDQLWDAADVRVEGDPETQRELRAALYHLMRANPRDPRAAIDAKMNGGDAYWGRIFWDSEMFLVPFFIYALPTWARPLVQYRHVTLNGARRRAAQLGYRGARYAWESEPDGSEGCPSFQYADHEVHVSSDVVLGLWHYVQASGDTAFLHECAAEVVFEVARYWTSRMDYLPGSRHAHLLCVMGPDEYMHAANDNAYTNYLARWVLSLAEQLATRARRDRRLAAVMRRVRVTAAEVRIWRRLARIILVPYDPARNLVLQSRDFEDKAPIDFATYWRDRRKLFGMQVSQERLYRSRALKQADVLMLMQLFRTHFTDAQIQTAMAYYEPYTTHDSSLSTSTHAIVAARLGDIRKAWDYFTRARGIDFAPRSTGAAEGVHAANAGALWQCVVIGFLGLTPAYLDETFSLAPLLPRHWRGVHATLHWRGARIRVEARPFATTITANTALRARVYDRVVRCRPGIPVTVAAPAPASEG